MMNWIRAWIVLLVLEGIAGLAVVYSGVINVGADKAHLGPTRWMLATALGRSVARHAKGIQVPALGDPAQLKMGFQHYKGMCIGCHGAPGVKVMEITRGLNPRAPDLSEAVKDLSPAELYWIIKHGIRMTGMPAFGASHSEPELWSMVAFLRRMAEMSPDDYRRFSAANSSGAGESHEKGEHHHAHAHSAAGEAHHSPAM